MPILTFCCRQCKGSKLRPKVLQHVAVPVIENHVCEGWHRRKGIDIRIYDEMMCAGYELGQRDACQVSLFHFVLPPLLPHPHPPAHRSSLIAHEFIAATNVLAARLFVYPPINLLISLSSECADVAPSRIEEHNRPTNSN